MIVMIYAGFSTSITAQVYLEKQTRHRFAQLNVGVDTQVSLGGFSYSLDQENQINHFSLPAYIRPRIILGGLHFWGHADFYIAIPVADNTVTSKGQDIFYSTGVETVFKYYPWSIQERKLRPYLGFSLAPIRFRQNSQGHKGPLLSYVSVPVVSGLTFQHKNKLLELGVGWNTFNEQQYYLSRDISRSIETPPFYVQASLRWVIDTTLDSEESWESGATKQQIEKLVAKGKLDGFFVGAGLSSAWWTKKSSYNEEERPFIGNYDVSMSGDFALGYYWHNADLNISINYRRYSETLSPYDLSQELERKSIGLEITKYLLDYQGFDPFVGSILTYENLSLKKWMQEC